MFIIIYYYYEKQQKYIQQDSSQSHFADYDVFFAELNVFSGDFGEF